MRAWGRGGYASYVAAAQARHPNSPLHARAHTVQVATLDSVILYSTNSWLPLALLGNLHYDSITDLAWSADGQYLAVASRDG